MAERSKALRSGRSPLLWAWVRIPLLTTNFFSPSPFTESRVAQWKRAGPITQRSVDRNYALLAFFFPSKSKPGFFFSFSFFSSTLGNLPFLPPQQRGAVEACWAHNPEVDGSKPSAARFFFVHWGLFIFHISLFSFANSKSPVLV